MVLGGGGTFLWARYSCTLAPWGRGQQFGGEEEAEVYEAHRDVRGALVQVLLHSNEIKFKAPRTNVASPALPWSMWV